jgi:hypothetical protein
VFLQAAFHKLSFNKQFMMKTVSLFNLVTKAAITIFKMMVEGEGFEPSKAEPSDLQSDPFGHSGIPPRDCFVLR